MSPSNCQVVDRDDPRASQLQPLLRSESIKTVSQRGSWICPLSSSRRTSRYLNELCTPLVYSELDILPRPAAMHNIAFILSHYPEHVRRLRIGITRDYTRHSRGDEYDRLILEALRVCLHTTSLGIYFDDTGSEVPTFTYEQYLKKLVGKVTALITRREISSLGIYSVDFEDNDTSWGSPTFGIRTILRALIPVLDGKSAVRRLVVAADTLNQDIYDGLQSKATSIQSLTFKASLAVYHVMGIAAKVCSAASASKWPRNTNLTHLRLMNCKNAYALHIPELVLHFSSLKFLLVTACGNEYDMIPPPRIAGWSQESTALWRQRPPLDVFHIEYMLEWAILAMGTIPSKTVIATSIRSGDLTRAFITDPELFPCLTCLRIEGTETKGGRGLPIAGELDEDLWQRGLKDRRGILVQEDADFLFNR
jgi:hypothetical protein